MCGFPQKIRVNVKNVFLLCKGLKSPTIKGLSKLSYDWKCPFRQQENFWGKIWKFYLFTKAMLLWWNWDYKFCGKPDTALLLCVCHKHIILTFFFFNYLIILLIMTPGVPFRNYWISAIKQPNQMANKTLKFEEGNWN